MPLIDPKDLSPSHRHRLVVDCIVPRPIAWVTTCNEDGAVNLAPFSYFMGVTASPPSLAISIGARNPLKDTLANLRAIREAVVQIVPPDCLQEVVRSSGEFARGVDEAALLKLETLPSVQVRPPRLARAQVALECRLSQEVQVGSPGASLCILEIVLAHVLDGIAGGDGLPDPRKLRAVARLGEQFYLRGDGWRVTEIPRPQVPEELAVRRG